MSDNNTILLYIGVGSMAFTGIGLILRYCLKSKCSRVSICWGVCEIVRDIEAEEHIEEHKIHHQMEHGESSKDSFPISFNL